MSRRRGLPVGLALVMLTAACSVSSPSGTPGASAASPGQSLAGPSLSAAPDLSAHPLVWFAPLGPRADHMGYGGSVDYYDLFKPDAPWAEAASHVQVFEIPSTWVHYYSTDDELRTVVNGVAARGMALALAVGPLKVTEECDQGEGFGGTYELEAVRRIQSVGGRVDIAVLDEPYAFGHIEDQARPCHYPAERVAQEIADFVHALRQIEPAVVVGADEPMWTNISPDDFAAWLDTYQSVAGEPLAFLHLDADWSRRDWPQAFLATENAARERGVPIGVLYNGDDADSDAEWNRRVMDRAYLYEQVTGGRPDHVVLTSWMDHPDRTLPESDPTTFTGLIRQYFGARPAISAAASGRSVSGTVSADGAGLAAASLSFEAVPGDGPVQTLRLEGTVPEGVRRAVAGIRVNREGAGPGAADFRIYEVSYAEAGSANLIPNPRFEHGLEYWGADGSGAATLVPSDRGGGTMLRVTSDPTQDLGVDVSEWAVEPGAAFSFSAVVSVPLESATSASIALIFLADVEGARAWLPMAPQPIPLASVTTDGSGAFSVSLDALVAGRYLIRASVMGAAGHWPASAEIPVDLE